MQILFVLYGVEAKQSAGYCAMYDICGARSDGKVLNCPFNIPAVKVSVCCVYLLLKKTRAETMLIWCTENLFSSPMICYLPRFKACAQQSPAMFVAQRLNLILYVHKFNR